MTELADQLERAHEHLVKAQTFLRVGYPDEAGRAAYLAGFNAAQGYLFSVTGRTFKTHNGVHSQFYQLVKDNDLVDNELKAFLSRAYNLKTIADYEGGPSLTVPVDVAVKTLGTAERFVALIEQLTQGA